MIDSERFMYDLLVNSRVDFANEWSGWKMRGAVLISPEGDRIRPERLRGLLFGESLKKRKKSPSGKTAPSMPDPVVVCLGVRRVA